jgi:MFS family permease
MTNRWLLYATAFLRALATGMIALVLAAYLTRLGFSSDSIGIVVGAGLGGNAVALGVASGLGPRIRAKRLLVLLAAMTALGALVVAYSTSTTVIVLASFGGMLNGMGRDRGAALAIEQAILPATTTDARRTQAFAWYNALQDVGHALGALLAGVPSLVARGRADASGDRVLLWVFAALAALSVLVYSGLRVGDIEGSPRPARLSPDSKRILMRICGLFALDSLGGGFLTTALVSYFFFERFGASEGVVAVLFFAARIANALSHLGAAGLARRIGLVRTMVFTHMPSSILLVTVAFAPTFVVAAGLFLIRESLVEMDVPTRQSYLMAIVRPHERTQVSGVTNLVRMAGWALAPFASGVLMQHVSLIVPLIVGASLKVAYDVTLYRAFRHVAPPEEAAA